MNYRIRRFELCVLTIFSVLYANDTAEALGDFLGGFSKFNDVAQGVGNFIRSDAGQSVFQALDKAGKAAGQKSKSVKYFKDGHFYIGKDRRLYVYKDKELKVVNQKTYKLKTFLEGNVYVLNGKNYIYTKKDAIDPTVGHFVPIVFKDGQLYHRNGELYKCVKGELVKYDVKSDGLEEDNSETTSEETDDTNQIETTSNEDQGKLNKIKLLFKQALSSVAKTKIVNLGQIDVNSLSAGEYNLVVKWLGQLKTKSPSTQGVIVFASKTDTTDKSRLDNFKKVCEKSKISILPITRKNILTYIYNGFTKNSKNIVDLTKCDIGQLTTSEVYFIYCCAVDLLIKRVKEGGAGTPKLQLNIKVSKNDDRTQKNFKIIQKFSKTYSKYATVKTINQTA